MIFITVGTSFPFDRLVQAIDDAVTNKEIEAEFFAQVGKGGYRPKNFDSVETLNKGIFDEHFEKADAVISHAGMGTIAMALEQNKPIMVMPRMKKYKELVNDHQLSAAKRFEKLGHVISAYDTTQLIDKFTMLKSFVPIHRESSVKQVSARIGVFLWQCLKTAK
jgi:UDP-N-acetylglucosamine transferase subunit ALG13